MDTTESQWLSVRGSFRLWGTMLKDGFDCHKQ